MDTRTKEAIRYLGYGTHAVGEELIEMIAHSFDELDKIVQYRWTCRIFDLKREETYLSIGTMKIDSKNLQKNLKGCKQVFLLGATLGIGVDLLMKRCALTNMTKTLVLQACAAAMLEEYLDETQEDLAKQLKEEEKYLRPRFSPGYGDFSIMHQRELLQMLDAPKKIGLTMTDGYMLTPMKSVTAVIGISETKEPCHRKGCEVCEKIDCMFRRNSEC